MKKTKIVCTIGPASNNEKTLSSMCKAGMNVARLNFSHGTHEDHEKNINLIKKVREDLQLPIAILLDTKGPEYRIGTFKDGKIINATANDTQKLNAILDTDDGARYIGEFAFGVNPYITKPMGDILFDEKTNPHTLHNPHSHPACADSPKRVARSRQHNGGLQSTRAGARLDGGLCRTTSHDECHPCRKGYCLGQQGDTCRCRSHSHGPGSAAQGTHSPC